MTETKTPAAPSVRWAYLVTGVIAMLFAGVIYAWSILKAPFSNEFGWNANQLALNFTLTMCCFCLGGLLGSMLSKRLGFRVALFVAAVLGCAGFLLTSTLTGGSVALLYVFYAVLAGLGIGVAYNVTISTVSRWFPDKKGLCSGCLMMGFGASALVLGNLANGMFASAGWRTTYLVLGVALGVIIAAAALILRAPGADTVLPELLRLLGLEQRCRRPGPRRRAKKTLRSGTCAPARCSAGPASGWPSWPWSSSPPWAAASSPSPRTWPCPWARRSPWP